MSRITEAQSFHPDLSSILVWGGRAGGHIPQETGHANVALRAGALCAEALRVV
jgi:hypothetical protein